MDLKEMVAKKQELIRLKKSAIKHSDTNFTTIKKTELQISKNVNTDTDEVITRDVVANTYYYMDNHDDVHVKGCFAKTIKENSGNIFHLHDHKFEISAKVGIPSLFTEKELSWKELGVEKDGMTTSLVMKTDIIKDYNEKIFKGYKKGEIKQHSVGMRYIKIDLAVNDKEEKEEYANWTEFIDKIANKERAEQKGYFWVVKEAALMEVSAVLLGSNPITGVLETKIEPSKDTHEIEAEKSLLQKEFYNNLI